MKRTLLAIFLLAISGPIVAQDMTIDKKDGQSVEVGNLSKLSFSDDSITVTADDGKSQSYSNSSIGKLRFGQATQIAPVKAIDGKLEYSVQNLMAVVRDSKGETLSIFNLSGKAVLEKSITTDSQEIDLSGLAKGVYLLRLGSKTVKIVL